MLENIKSWWNNGGIDWFMLVLSWVTSCLLGVCLFACAIIGRYLFFVYAFTFIVCFILVLSIFYVINHLEGKF